jgi:shikimate dehydrogenase
VKAPPGRLVLLGHPVAHSLSPAMQNAALDAAGIDLRYEALDVAPGTLPSVLRDLLAARSAGNVTVPHKPAMMQCCERLTTPAARTGAVNTFWHDDDGTLHGDNTDIGGFSAQVETLAGTPRPGWIVALFGAGGAAAAVCAAVESWPDARVRILARTRDRADRLAARFPTITSVIDAEPEHLAGCDLVVNATPVGLHGDDLPLELALVPPGVPVIDLVYRPGETFLTREARAAGHPAADGLEMLLEQGALAFERWFDRPPDREVMRAALKRYR